MLSYVRHKRFGCISRHDGRFGRMNYTNLFLYATGLHEASMAARPKLAVSRQRHSRQGRKLLEPKLFSSQSRVSGVPKMRGLIGIAVAACLAVGLSGCASLRAKHGAASADSASVDRGKATIIVYGCGKCHSIPGIPGAHGVVGPPLNFLPRRTYIAGQLPNTPENLIHWVMSPQSIKAKTDMPALGLSEPQAKDVAAYLDTLK